MGNNIKYMYIQKELNYLYHKLTHNKNEHSSLKRAPQVGFLSFFPLQDMRDQLLMGEIGLCAL